jgi:hypothetical protein
VLVTDATSSMPCIISDYLGRSKGSPAAPVPFGVRNLMLGVTKSIQ